MGLDLAGPRTQHSAMPQRKSDTAPSAGRPSSPGTDAAREVVPSSAMLLTTWSTKVVEANQEALALLGVRHGDHLIGKPLAVFVDLVDRTAFRSRLNEVPQTGGCSDWRLHLRRPDGAMRAVLATVEPATSGASADGRCDLRWTIRIDADAVPRVAQQDVDELIRTLAHDLNQPLAAIVSYARGCLMRMEKKTLTNDDLEMVLEQIVAEALRAGATIREFRRKDS